MASRPSTPTTTVETTMRVGVDLGPVPEAERAESRARSRFAEAVLVIRSAKGYSQTRVASHGGLSRGYLGMLENGQRGEKPGRGTVLRVAEGLDATEEERDLLLRAAGYEPLNREQLADIALGVEDAITADPHLSEPDRTLLVSIYRSLRSRYRTQ